MSDTADMAEQGVPRGLDVPATAGVDEEGRLPSTEAREFAPALSDMGEDTRAIERPVRVTPWRVAALALNVALLLACLVVAVSDLLWPPPADTRPFLPPAQTATASVTVSGGDSEQPGAPPSRATATPTQPGGSRARHTPTTGGSASPTAGAPTATATTAPPTATATPVTPTPTPTPPSGG